MSRSLLVKTIKGETFRIDVAEESMMRDVKAKISEVRGEDPATQLLICGGKTLKDDDPLATSVAAGGFLVLMIKKKRVNPAAPATSAPAAAASAAAPAPAPAAAPSPASAAPAPAASAAAAATPASAPAPSPPPTAAAGAGTGAGAGASAGGGDGLAVDPPSVEMLTAMGFPEDQATVALRAAFNDVSRAASYLMEGIPDDVMAAGAGSGGGGGSGDRQQGGDAMMMAGGDGEGGGAPGLAEALMQMQGGEGNPLNFMRFHPQFDELRNLVRENPAMLPQVLQGLASQSPELIERINQHPDDFLRLMNEPPDAEGQAMMEMGAAGFLEGMEDDEEDGGDEGEAAAAAAVAAGGVGVGVGVAGGEGGQGGSVTVELTEEENAAVENLMAMVPGVGRDQVIEAFIACDKNAEMAANLLFENAL